MPAPDQPPQRSGRGARSGWRRFSSVAFFVLTISIVAARTFNDLSRPEAWAYWRDLYLSPSMTSSVIANADVDRSGPRRTVMAISGTIGPAAASWFRERLDEAHLVAGDFVLLSSPGGDLNQAIIMGEIIRSRGLTTAVGIADASGHIGPSYCASACVFVYAGGKIRIGIEGSMLGVHRFVSPAPGRDPVAETQRTAGLVLSYMTKMGVSSALVEAMSATSDIRWLGVKEAHAMDLVTDPVPRP
jgi:hypothetical protein